MADLLERIVDGGLCHGCGACASAIGLDKVDMVMSAPGYLRPKARQPLDAEQTAVLEQVCSGYTLDQDADKNLYDDSWGPLVTVEAGYALAPDVRYRGSSGGVTSALVLHLLETGQIDFVLHTRASPTDPVGNVTTPSYTRDEILQAAGSRYATSTPLADLEKHLASGSRFAFIGKPCDVASLRRMAKRDPRIDAQVPIMLSFFCAGVPSRAGALAVLKKLGVTEDDLTAFNYRGNGWPGLTRAIRHDGTEATMDYNSSWGNILSRHLQFRCKICPEGIGEFADIACADAWYGKDGYPDFTEREGRSLVIARTARGRRLLDAALAARIVELEPLDKGEIRLMQPYQYDRKRGVLARLTALWLKGRLLPRFRGMRLPVLMMHTSPFWLLRNFIGTFRRVSRKAPLN